MRYRIDTSCNTGIEDKEYAVQGTGLLNPLATAVRLPAPGQCNSAAALWSPMPAGWMEG